MVDPGDDAIVSTRPGVRARLTALERAVLAASATGLVVAEVAEVLDLAPETVRDALMSTAAKLGARSKLEALIVALREGLIDSDGAYAV